MRSLLVVHLEETLIQGSNLKAGLPVDAAIRLYQAMRSSDYRTVILADGEREWAEAWLKREHVAFDMLRSGTASVLSGASWRASEVRDFQADGWHVDFYMDSDTEAVDMVLAQGVATLHISYPRYSRQDFRPEGTPPREWNDLVSTIEAANTKKEV